MSEFTADAKQIKKWKEENGAAIEILVYEKPNKKGKKFRCFIGDPLKDLNLFSAGMDESSLMTRKLFFLDNLWIAGDEGFKTNSQVRVAGAIEAYANISILESEAKKH